MLQQQFLRISISVAFLIAVLIFIDIDVMTSRITKMNSTWLLLALISTLPQYFFSAKRWQITADSLGVQLPFRVALSEYYLSAFTNQVLPGGVLGDAARAMRHGYRLSAGPVDGEFSDAVYAVMLERLSGQLALFIFVLVGLFFWPGDIRLASYPIMFLICFIVFGISIFLILIINRVSMMKLYIAFILREILSKSRRALFDKSVVFKQLIYSLTIVVSYLFSYYLAAKTISLQLTIFEVFIFVPVILFSMVIPLTIAGWGIREASAAAIWSFAGLSSSDGVAISITYGVIILLSALPGVFVLIFSSNRIEANH